MNGRERVNALRRPMAWSVGLAMTLGAALAGCGNNSPWPDGSEKANVIRSAMTENTPRHLDPTASYWSNDTLVTYQVYEPPYGYHYLKRPFELVPEVGRPKSSSRSTSTRTAAACPTTRRPSWSPRASTTCRSRRASCSSRTRPSRKDDTGPLPLPRHEAGRARRAAHADGVRAHRHARAGGRGLRLCAEAPRHDAHHDADLRHLLRVRARPEGLRRPDQAAKTPSCARAWTRPAWTSPSSTSAAGRWPAPPRPKSTCCACASRASTRSGSTGCR